MTLYKNIIFDLGGVILTIDYRKTIQAFRDLGIPGADELYSQASQNLLFDKLEKGLLSETDFYEGIRSISGKKLSDAEIQNAWNAILIGLPDENIEFLKRLKENHRIFLLSNTNSIHENAYRTMIIKQYGSFVFDDLFEKMYLSHRIHLRKPEPEIFRYVLEDSKLNIEETCFIDDSLQHIVGAEKVNLKAFLFKGGDLGEFLFNLRI